MLNKLSTFVLMLFVAGALLVQQVHAVASAGTSTNTNADTTRVLFVGNSYIYYNNLPRLFTAVAASKGKPVVAEMIVHGGARLEEHAANKQLGKHIAEGDWDYVVLQEQSTIAGQIVDGRLKNPDIDGFHKAASALHEVIKEAGAETVFHLTWARAHAPEMQHDLNRAYYAIARQLNTPISPIGKTWAMAKQRMSSTNLYQEDESHPSPAGSYLSAVTLFATIFNESPTSATGKITGHPVEEGLVNRSRTETLVDLSMQEYMMLQEIAWRLHREEMKAGGHE
ncbi:MAG: DUF4886 domain-containing protein [Rhodothermales bacterium]